MRGLLQLRDQFLQVLSEAQKLRDQKSQCIGDELAWVIYEREVMLGAVNAVCSQRDCQLVTMKEVKRAERCASGHVDYSQKFALYCAELALRDSVSDSDESDPDESDSDERLFGIELDLADLEEELLFGRPASRSKNSAMACKLRLIISKVQALQET